MHEDTHLARAESEDLRGTRPQPGTSQVLREPVPKVKAVTSELLVTLCSPLCLPLLLLLLPLWLDDITDADPARPPACEGYLHMRNDKKKQRENNLYG